MPLDDFNKDLRLVRDADSIIIARGTKFNELIVTLEGQKREGIVPKLPFPLSHPFFVILVDEQGTDVAMVKDYGQLDQASKKILEGSIDRTYFMPRITAIGNLETSGDEFVWDVETDKGQRTFRTRGRRSISLVGSRVVIADVDDNLYIVTDLMSLDSKSRSYLESIF